MQLSREPRKFGVKAPQRSRMFPDGAAIDRNSHSSRATSEHHSTLRTMAQRIAAIDVGTNSIHMIVAEARPRRGYRVVDREKDVVQLGLSSLDAQPLTDEAIDRRVLSIAKMSEIAQRWNADEVIAVATSAVREAPNRREFIRLVREACGGKLRV